jgi:hypothetical protein
MAKSKKKRQRRQAATQPQDPNIHRAKPPKQRLKKLLDLARQVAVVAESQIIGMRLPSDEAEHALLQFEVAILARGTNSLKAIATLCGDGHWEFAVGIVRQLFELVLNLEHIDAQPNRYRAAVDYAKFGLLQMLIRRGATMSYEGRTGRPVDSEEQAWVESMLSTQFPEYRVGKRGRWAESWSGKTTKQLAIDSPRAIRKDQYELLFREWSEQSHASPGALIASMFADFDVARIIEDDDVRIAEAVTMAVGFFVDLQGLLRVAPTVPIEQLVKWMDEALHLAQRYGAVPPGRPTQPDPA